MTAAPPSRNASNRTGLDYRALAAGFARLPYPIIDVHAHVNGARAVHIMKEAMDLYGVKLVYSMTALEQAEVIRAALGDRVRFIAVPDFMHKDRRHAHGADFVKRIEAFHKLGCRICKFWAAPRGMEFGIEAGEPRMLWLDSPTRLATMEAAAGLGMIFMTHVGDPNTWFSTRYKDASKYGSKLEHYEPLEKLLDRFRQPWIGAHFGGWPEDLEFLSGLLGRHPNLVLDSSATKWIVREISKHPRDEIIDFLRRWQGRILFGSDIVTTDDHLEAKEGKTEMGAKASNAESAFDLYASRYWALRTLWETDFSGESPISDPDLAMVDPQRFTPMDAPMLHGKSLPPDLLRSLYSSAAESLLEPLHRTPAAAAARP